MLAHLKRSNHEVDINTMYDDLTIAPLLLACETQVLPS